MNLIQQLEQEEIARLNKEIPAFAPGDTVIVSTRVVEGTRSRLQAYEGVVIARRNRGLNSAFIVRKISSGQGNNQSPSVSIFADLDANASPEKIVTIAAELAGIYGSNKNQIFLSKAAKVDSSVKEGDAGSFSRLPSERRKAIINRVKLINNVI